MATSKDLRTFSQPPRKLFPWDMATLTQSSARRAIRTTPSSKTSVWFQAAGNQQPKWDKYRLPPKVRHGSMLPILRKQYDALVTAFGIELTQ